MMCDFNLSQDEKTLEIIDVGPVWNNDPFLRIRKDVGVPTVQLEQVKAEDEREEEEEVKVPPIPIVKPRPSRKKTTKPDLKRKGAFLSPK